MNTHISLFVFFLLCPYFVSNAQTPTIEMPVASTEKYNYRGYLNGDAYNVRGKEIIGEYDGNLMLRFAQDLDIPGDLKTQLTIIYNANVSHAIRFANEPGNPSYFVNSPEWIIGVYGFAVQTLNFETNYYATWKQAQVLTNSQLPMLIPGYHYCNKMAEDYQYTGEYNQYEETRDIIRLLLADGSVRYLVGDDSLGVHYDDGKENYGYAILKTRPGYTRLRQMWYKPGDGLTYYFIEEPVEYFGKGVYDNSPTYPKAMYLSKIISAGDDTLTIQYANAFGSDPTFNFRYGRKFFYGIQSNKVRNSNTTLNIVSKESPFFVNYDFFNYSGSVYLANIILSPHRLAQQYTLQMNTVMEQAALNLHDSSSTRSRILRVTEITDFINRTDEISYTQTSRHYKFSSMTYGGLPGKVQVQSNLINTVDYWTKKKSVFSYFGPYFDSAGSDTIDFSTSAGGYINANMSGKFRDSYTNYMVKQRCLYNDNEIDEAMKENYSYSWNRTFPWYTDSMRATLIKDIRTTVQSIIRSGARYDTTFKSTSFDRYNTGVHPYSLQDRCFEVKIASDSVYGTSGHYATSFMYDIYPFETGFYKGTFREKSKTLNDNSFITQFIEDTIAYVSFAQKSILKRKRVLDPQVVGLTDDRHFTNFLPSVYDTNGFYKIGLDSAVIRSRNGQIVNAVKKSYYDANAVHCKGSLKQITANIHSNRPDTLDFGYAVKTPFAFAGRDSSITGNGLRVKNEYLPWKAETWGSKTTYHVWDTIAVKKLLTNGSAQDYVKWMYGGPLTAKPYKMSIIAGGADTFTVMESDLPTGGIDFTLGLNGEYSAFSHDWNSGRLTSATFPGDFEQTQTQDTSYLPFRNDIGCGSDPIYPTTGDTGRAYQQNHYVCSDPPECNAYSTTTTKLSWHVKLSDSLEIYNLSNVSYAFLDIQCAYDFTTSEDREVFLKAVFDSSGTRKIVGSLLFQFIPGETVRTDVKQLILDSARAGWNLIGFRFDCTINQVPIPPVIDQYKAKYFYLHYPVLHIAGTVSRTSSWSGRSFFIAYDDANRITTAIVKKDSSSELNIQKKFDSFGFPAKLSMNKNPFPQTVEYQTKQETEYNGAGLLWKEKDGEGRTVYTRYDFLGRPVEKRFNEHWGTGAFSQTIYSSDSSGAYRTEQLIDECGRTVKKYYNRANNIVWEVFGGGDSIKTHYEYDVFNRLIKVTSPRGLAVEYTYDDLGNISTKQSPDEGLVKHKYDKYKNLRFTNYPADDSTKIVFAVYDPFKRLLRKGITTAGLFDNRDPDTEQTFDTDTSDFVLVNMYDKYNKSGIFAAMTDPVAGIGDTIAMKGHPKGKLVATAFRDRNWDVWSYKVFSYDHLGRVTAMWVKFRTDGWRRINTLYDNLGNITFQGMNTQDTVNDYYSWNTYDVQGRLDTVSSAASPVERAVQAVYAYNAADQIASLQYPFMNGTDSLLRYEYNCRGWLRRISSLFFRQVLSYEPNGNIKEQYVWSAGTNWQCPQVNAYSYNDRNMLDTSLSNNDSYTEYFRYDKDGNIVSKHKTSKPMAFSYYLGTNKLAAVDLGQDYFTFTYDERGNMRVKSTAEKDIEFYSYDHRNLPLAVDIDHYFRTSYAYDDGGNRIIKQDLADGEYYLRDHTGRELAILNRTTNKLKSVNLYGMGKIGEVELAWGWTPPLHEHRYYFKDHLGSIRLVTDSAGNVWNVQDYYPFGEIMREGMWSSSLNRYRFTEKYRDAETNFDYFGARYYDSELGRWLSVDPMADKYPGWSPYNYCFNNPIIIIDPDGREVLAKTKAEQEMILNTLPENERKYVVFDKNGRITKGLMNSFQSKSDNYNALLQIVNSNQTFEAILGNQYSYIDQNNKLQTESMGEIRVDPDIKSYYTPSSSETGNTGLTILPDDPTVKSTNGNIQIYINKNLSSDGRAQTFSHEGYGHAYMYSLGQNPNHIYVKTKNGFTEGNTNLKSQIVKSVAETIRNMKK